jgi:hypothetical protein
VELPIFGRTKKKAKGGEMDRYLGLLGFKGDGHQGKEIGSREGRGGCKNRLLACSFKVHKHFQKLWFRIKQVFKYFWNVYVELKKIRKVFI